MKPKQTTFDDLEKFTNDQLKDLSKKGDKDVGMRAARVLVSRLVKWMETNEGIDHPSE